MEELKWYYLTNILVGSKEDNVILKTSVAQSAGVAEYTDCISAEWEYSLNRCPGYDTKQSGGEAPVMLVIWRTPSLPSLSGPFWLGVVVRDRVLSMDHLEVVDISSSSCRAANTDIPDPLSPLLSIIHRLWQVFRTTSRILT